MYISIYMYTDMYVCISSYVYVGIDFAVHDIRLQKQCFGHGSHHTWEVQMMIRTSAWQWERARNLGECC